MEELLADYRVFRVVRTVEETDRGERERFVVRHPGAAVIVPILDDGRVCLIENYRIAVKKRLIELPAGTLEPGEGPLETARRELAEETGYRARSVESLGHVYSSPGVFDERMYLFLATGLTDGETALEVGERIVTRLTPWREALKLVHSGAIEDAKTVVGLLKAHAQGVFAGY
jgi:ADP-ribose pyrophosphatase